MFDTAIPQLYLVAMGGDKFTQDFEDEQIRMGDFGTESWVWRITPSPLRRSERSSQDTA